MDGSIESAVIFAKRNMEIVIDWSKISSPEEFYKVFLPQVDAPEWHGENLDALNDSVVTGDVNGINPPYKITNLNVSSAHEQIQDFMRSVLSVFSDSAIEYPDSEITIR